MFGSPRPCITFGSCSVSLLFDHRVGWDGVEHAGPKTTLPDFDQGRLWVVPCGADHRHSCLLESSSDVLGIDGVRLEINVWDKKGRLHALWRKDLSAPGMEQSFREVGVGLANLGSLGSRNTALRTTVSGPSAYIAWGHTRRTVEWQRGRGKGTLPMTVMWGIRAEWLSRRVDTAAPGGATEEFNLGLFLPLFVRIQLPVG